jgi:CheY-like chemotaxis protein
MSKRILVIDDEEAFRSTLREVLGEAGYQVDVTPYLASAVGTALAGKYDLITLDLRMPGLDGLEIAKLFQSYNSHIRVLVISGYLDPRVVAQLKALGVKHFLDKPLDIGEIIQAVEDAMSGTDPG